MKFHGLKGKSLVAGLVLAFSLGLGSCEEQGTMEKAGEEADEAMEKAKDDMEKAKDDMEKAGEEMEKMGDKIMEEMGN